jgi:hypothetical protein
MSAAWPWQCRPMVGDKLPVWDPHSCPPVARRVPLPLRLMIASTKRWSWSGRSRTCCSIWSGCKSGCVIFMCVCKSPLPVVSFLWKKAKTCPNKQSTSSCFVAPGGHPRKTSWKASRMQWNNCAALTGLRATCNHRSNWFGLLMGLPRLFVKPGGLAHHGAEDIRCER